MKDKKQVTSHMSQRSDDRERIRILYLIDKLAPAGTQTNLLEIVRNLDREKFEPKVISLIEGGELVSRFRDAGVEPITLQVKRAYGLTGLKTLIFLIRFMKAEKIDIVQNFFLHADILGTIAGKIAGVPHIITTRRDEGFWRSARQLFLMRWMNRYVNEVMVNSEAVKRAVMRDEKIAAQKITVIHNGISASRYQPSEETRIRMRELFGISASETVIGVVANMKNVVKGHSYLLEAMPEILREIPHAKLVLVGEGELQPGLEKYAEKLGIREKVLFTGSRKDIAELLNAFDVFCLPSISEGFSNAILEAMATGKPVVAANVGGNSEMIEDGKSGYLVLAHDSHSLADRIIALAKNKAKRESLGQNARNRIVQEFSIETMNHQYQNHYEKKLIKKDKSSSKKILYLIWSIDLGGAEQVVMNLAKGIRSERFEPVVGCLNQKGRYAGQLENEGIRVVAFRKIPKFDPFLIFKLVSFLKKEKINLIHTHLFTANLWGRLAGRIAGVPVISSEHNVDEWKRGFHFTLDRILLPMSRSLVFVSDKVRQFYSQHLPALEGRCRVLHNGIDVKAYQNTALNTDWKKDHGLSEDKKIIGTAGRLVPQKDYWNFIRAIKKLKIRGLPILGVIIGEGPLTDSLKEYCRQMDVEKEIQFEGFSSDMPQMYHMMDVFVLPSLREGFPMTILEAMASGVPVVATDVGGVREAISHKETGMLVDSRNSQALADAISDVLNDRDLRESIIQNARQRVEAAFSVDRMVQDHRDLYEEVLRS